MERLYEILRKRTAIEASMLATSKNTDDAFTIAEKAFTYAVKRRRQGLTRHQSVRASKNMIVCASVDPVNRRSQHDLDLQENSAASRPQTYLRRPYICYQEVELDRLLRLAW